MGQRHETHARRRGSALLQGLLAFLVMGALGSLAVDLGLYYSAKSELQAAADAAALAGGAVADQGASAAYAEALRLAQANLVAGQVLPDSSITVQVGHWTDGQFHPTTGTPMAVRVRLGRSHTSGNPIPLSFGSFVGLDSVDVYAESIVKVRPDASPYNLVGINSASFGSLGVLAGINGRIVSNGNVDIGYPLGLFVGVNGQARSYGGVVRKGIFAGISGSTAPLDEELVYPSVVAPSTNDNAQIAAYLDAQNNFNAIAFASIPSGTYVVHDLNFLAGLSVQLQGPVTFYVQDDVNLAVGVNLLGNPNFDPSMFKIRVMPGGKVNFLANLLTPINMDLYAPDSDIIVAVGVNAYNGRLIGKTLNIALPVLGQFTENQSLGDPLGEPGKLMLVH